MGEALERYLLENRLFPLTENMKLVTHNSILYDVKVEKYFYVVAISGAKYFENSFINGKYEDNDEVVTKRFGNGYSDLYIYIP